jgi:hypothetical protein
MSFASTRPTDLVREREKSGRGLAGEPDPALIVRDDCEVTGQRRHHQAPLVPRPGPNHAEAAAVDRRRR